MKVIWAIDPSEVSRRSRATVARLLIELRSGAETVTIEPVFVSAANAADASRTRAAMSAIGRDPSLAPLLAPRVLSVSTRGGRGLANALSNYAARARADLVVVNTRSRGPIERLRSGSFTEALIYRSRVPVVALSPRTRRVRDLGRILYPTAFEADASGAFRRVVEVAARIGAEVTVYHMICPPIRPFTGADLFTGRAYWRRAREYVAAETLRTGRLLRAWEAYGRKRGVRIRPVIECGEGGIADRVVRLAIGAGTGLIFVRPLRGAFASSLFGSVTRQILRSAFTPVGILRPSEATTREAA